MMQSHNKFAGSDVALYGMFISVTIVLSYLESIIPMPIPIPGIKLGLANVVIIWLLYSMGIKAAVIVSVLRVLLSGFLFGNLFSVVFSLVGAALSLSVMILLKKFTKLSTVGVSIAGAVMHNVGQIIVAIIVLENGLIIYYLPYLIISGVVTGIFIGILGAILYKKIKILQTNVHM